MSKNGMCHLWAEALKLSVQWTVILFAVTEILEVTG